VFNFNLVQLFFKIQGYSLLAVHKFFDRFIKGATRSSQMKRFLVKDDLSNKLLREAFLIYLIGGAEGIRTPDHLNANQMLYR
jgi:hypothetical protein